MRIWFSRNQFLLLRRMSQILILVLFLLGPWFDIWWIKGNLSASLIFDLLPLTDPFVFLQSLFSGYIPNKTAWIGAVIVMVFYALLGGRVYCSWVCPLNVVTDAASWLRIKFGIKSNTSAISKYTRYGLLLLSLILPMLMGKIVWELVNPVSLLHRGIIFGMGFGWYFIGLIFLFDLFVVKNGWCGRFCPVGAFYSLLGKVSWLRINVVNQKACTDCLDCFVVCPEPQVINPALRGSVNSVVLDANCTNCGRCVDICEPKVFQYSSRFNNFFKSIKD